MPAASETRLRSKAIKLIRVNMKCASFRENLINVAEFIIGAVDVSRKITTLTFKLYADRM